MGYTTDAIRGVSWVGVFRVVSRIISFVRIVILARILLPAQFGAYGIAHLVLTFVEIITETGVNILLIQEKEKIATYIDSAWFVAIVRGFVIAALVYISAPFVASFFQTPEALPLLQLISVVPAIKGFINPSIVQFQKELQFNKEFYFRSTIFFIDSLFAVLFTLLTQSPIGIILGLIVGGITEVALSFIVVRPLPRFAIQGTYVSKIIHRGKWVTASGIFTYIFQNGSNLVVGRMLGASSLGLYQMAHSLSILPISEITDVFSRVTFPLYTKISDDRDRLKRAFYKVLLVSVGLTIPVSLVLFLFPHEIISLLLGSAWIEAAQVLQVLAIFAFVRSISLSTFPLFLSVGKQEYVTVTTMISTIGLGISILPLLFAYGIVGAAMAAVVGGVMALPVITYYTIYIFKKS